MAVTTHLEVADYFFNAELVIQPICILFWYLALLSTLCASSARQDLTVADERQR